IIDECRMQIYMKFFNCAQTDKNYSGLLQAIAFVAAVIARAKPRLVRGCASHQRRAYVRIASLLRSSQ
ncbi:MAG: hypothetical protein LBB73_02950, partial [Dysgonamonadaceae bacterium]|nr:hypothetical protein [Dysgonamonadaceae bacterium]